MKGAQLGKGIKGAAKGKQPTAIFAVKQDLILKKQAKGQAKGDLSQANASYEPTGRAEVRFESRAVATAALNLSGQPLEGKIVQVQRDGTSSDGTKVVVAGLQSLTQWQEIKDFFKPVGQPIFVARQDQAEVRFNNEDEAYKALQLNGTVCDEARIGVIIDPKSKDQTKVIVSGLKTTTQWQELKDHFSICGSIAHAQRVMGGGCKEFKPSKPQGTFAGGVGFGSLGVENRFAVGPVAEIRFDSPLAVESAVGMSGSVLDGHTIKVSADKLSQDGSKVIITGLGDKCEWQELKDHFKVCGNVVYAGKRKPMGSGVQKPLMKQAFAGKGAGFAGFAGFAGKGAGKGAFPRTFPAYAVFPMGMSKGMAKGMAKGFKGKW